MLIYICISDYYSEMKNISFVLGKNYFVKFYFSCILVMYLFVFSMPTRKAIFYVGCVCYCFFFLKYDRNKFLETANKRPMTKIFNSNEGLLIYRD